MSDNPTPPSDNPTPAPPPAPTPGWAKSPGRRRPGTPEGPSRTTQVLITIGLLAATVGVLIALFFWLDRFTHPRFMPLVISEYPAGVPPRAFVLQDAQALRELAWSASTTALNSQEKSLLLGELDTLRDFKPKVPVVLYVSCYVVFGPAEKDKGKDEDKDGKEVPYLLLATSKLEDRTTWVPLTRVLGAMQACPATHKVLLLDVMQPLIWPARGLLRSNATERVWPTLTEGTQGLMILTACSPGQVSHTAGELGHSAFAFHLQQGLAGKADRDRDGRVTLSELVGFVSESVDKWAVAHRGERQTPALLGELKDFPVTNQRAGAKDPAGLAADYPEELTAGWRKHDDWWQRGVDARRRDVFLKLGRALLRGDGRWRGGRTLDSGFRNEVSRLSGDYLALAPPAPGVETTLAEKLARAPLPASDPEDRKALARAVLKPIQAEADRLAKAYKDRPAALAKLVLEVAEDAPFGPDGAAVLAGLLAEAKGVEELEEVRFLTRLARRAGPRWSPEVARLAAETSRRSAEARLAAEGLGKVPDELEARRRRADQMLFSEDQPWDKTPHDLLRKLPDEYGQVRRDFAALRAAREVVDDVFCLLPSYPLSPEVGEKEVAACRQVLTRARKLRGLVNAPDRIKRLDEIRPLTHELRHGPDSLNRLLAPLQEEQFPGLINATRAGKKDETQMCRLLLSTPWPTADQRLAMWAAFREGAARTAGGSGPLPAWDAAATQAARDRLRKRDLWRVSGLVVSLLARADDPPAGLEAKLAELEANPKSQSAWDKLAEVVRVGWGED